jgi:TatD DNase family protein
MLRIGVPEALAAAAAAGITRVVTVGCDEASSTWSAQCAAEHPAVYAAVAIHPNELPSPTAPSSASAPALASVPMAPTGRQTGPETPPKRADGANGTLRLIEELAGQAKVVAVGETGLDYYWDSRPHELQQWWFRQHIAIAKRAGKALMIHDRDAHADVLRILAEEGPPEHVIFHCFSGDAEMAKVCAEAGYVMSFAGVVTFANAKPLREAALVAPPELILAETDAPYLTPMPNRGKRNSPAMTAYTIRFLAELKGLDLGEFCDTLTANAARVFGWPSPGSR